MIIVDNLRKTYGNGVQALRGVSLELNPGETLAVVGESGCGKSTLARHLLNLEKATSGVMTLNGNDLSVMPHRELAKHLQMIFQDPSSSLNPRRRVRDILAEPLKVQGTSSPEDILSKVSDAMSAVGLRPEMADRYPHMFSGGQKQRIGIARALITGAKYILCDEPVSALDVSVQAQVLNLLIDLQKRLNLSYLFISHDLGVVRFIADRIAVMYLGQIVEEGPADEVFHRPRHPYTRLLLESTPRVGEAPPADLTKASELPSPANPPPGCAFVGRCPYALPRCSEINPILESEGNRRWACHLAASLDLSSPRAEFQSP